MNNLLIEDRDYFSDVVDGYLEAALFFSYNPDSDQGEPLDEDYSVNDFTDEAVERATADCRKFLEACDPQDIEAAAEQQSYGHIGHDFWLTRNGAGVGFWDGDYEEALGERLTTIAETFPELHVWPCDEQKTIFFE